MAFRLVRQLLASCLPMEFLEQELGHAHVAEWKGALTVRAYPDQARFRLDLFEPQDSFHCGTIHIDRLPSLDWPGERVLREAFRTEPSRRLADVRQREVPFKTIDEDGLTYLCYTSPTHLKVACFVAETGAEVLVVEHPWGDLIGTRAEDLASVGILAPGKVPEWPPASVLAALFGRNHRQEHYDQRFSGRVARTYPVGEDGALTAVSYRDGAHIQTVVFGDDGAMVAVHRAPQLPPAEVVTGFDVLTRFFRAETTLEDVVRRHRERGHTIRECDEAGLHFVVAVSPDGFVSATAFGPLGAALLSRDRKVGEFDDASWNEIQARGLVEAEERHFRFHRLSYQEPHQPGSWPQPSLLRHLFAIPYQRQYYVQKMGAEPLASHVGDITVLVFESDGKLPAFAFAENGDFALFCRLPQLPPASWSGYQVLAAAFGHEHGWTLERFKAEFGNDRFWGEADECGLHYVCAVRDKVTAAVFGPDGRCLGQVARALAAWGADDRNALRRRGMMP
jgi:hypothetical protein